MSHDFIISYDFFGVSPHRTKPICDHQLVFIGKESTCPTNGRRKMGRGIMLKNHSYWILVIGWPS